MLTATSTGTVIRVTGTEATHSEIIKFKFATAAALTPYQSDYD